MAETKQQLITALLKEGQVRLAEIWNCSSQEASRRINDDRGIKLSELAKAFDELGVQLVVDNSVCVVAKDEIRAINLLANRYLERRITGDELTKDGRDE